MERCPLRVPLALTFIAQPGRRPSADRAFAFSNSATVKRFAPLLLPTLDVSRTDSVCMPERSGDTVSKSMSIEHRAGRLEGRRVKASRREFDDGGYLIVWTDETTP